MSNIMQSLWIGDKLSVMEKLSMKSFIDNGHEYHLYTYGDVEGIPEGVIVKDGNEIIDGKDIYRYKNGSVSAFSNLFRYTMLYKKGGYWVDTDMVCVKHFDIDAPYVISSEPDGNDYNKNIITSSLIKMPKGSVPAKHGIDIQLGFKKLILAGKMNWGAGPKSVKDVVKKFKLENYVLDWRFTCSCSFGDFYSIIEPNRKKRVPQVINSIDELPDCMCAIHMWNECWRFRKRDKNKKYHEDSLYEQLKRKYGIE